MSDNLNIVIIYTLEDPRTGEVRYVGKTGGGLLGRLRGHLKDRSETHKTHWIHKLALEGLKPVIDVIETMFNPTEFEWQEAERFWIESLRFCGCKLTNLASGGEGGQHCLESRQKMSAWQIGRKLTPEHIENMRIASTGRKHSDEAKEKIGAAHKGRKHSDEAKAKISAGHIGKKLSPEHIEKVRLTSIGRKQTHEAIARRVAAYKATVSKLGRKPISDESRRKISIANTGRKHTAETIERMKEARRQWHANLTDDQKNARIDKFKSTVAAKKQALEARLINN